MIKFYLYSEDFKGIKIAEVSDENLAYSLKQYCKNVYGNSRFLVTIKYPRKKEIPFCGNFDYKI